MTKKRAEEEKRSEKLAEPRELVFYGGENVQWLIENGIKLTTIRKANPKYDLNHGEIINLNVSDNEEGEVLRAVVIANNKTTFSGVHHLELALDGYGSAEPMIAFATFQGDENVEWGGGMQALYDEAQMQALEDLQSFYPDLQFEEGEVNAISFLVLDDRLEKFIKIPEFAEQIANNDIVGLLNNPIFRHRILYALYNWFEIQGDEATDYIDSLLATMD